MTLIAKKTAASEGVRVLMLSSVHQLAQSLDAPWPLVRFQRGGPGGTTTNTTQAPNGAT